MTRAYDEIIELIAAGSSPRTVIDFHPSESVRDRVRDLLARESSNTLSPDEKVELDDYLRLEHIMRLAKARAHHYLSPK